jgi:hypothetical protein
VHHHGLGVLGGGVPLSGGGVAGGAPPVVSLGAPPGAVFGAPPGAVLSGAAGAGLLVLSAGADGALDS